MKTKQAVKRTLALLFGLALLITCSTAAATEAAQEPAVPGSPPLWLPTQINWGMDVDGLTQATQEYSEALYLLRETDEIQEFWLELPPNVELPDLTWLDVMEAPVAPEDPAVDIVGEYYVFRYGRFACTGIEYGPGTPEVFTRLQDNLTAVYGDPVETYPGQALYMFNAYKESFPEELLGNVSGWWMGDDTHVYLMSVADSPYVFYVNKDNLYGDPPE